MLQAHSFCACIFHSNPLYSCLEAAKDKKKKYQSYSRFEIWNIFFLIKSHPTNEICFVFEISNLLRSIIVFQ